jgi:O-acetylserine/cysteine efflux transporter
VKTNLQTSATHFDAKDYSMALCIVIFWGLAFVAMKLGLRSFTAFQLGAGRYFFAAVPLIFFVPRPKLPLRWILFYSLVTGLGQFGLLFVALHVGMTAGLASVLMQTQVFFTALLSGLILHDRLQRRQIIGLSLAACAIVCFAWHFVDSTSAALHNVTLLGFALCLCGASMWGVSNIIIRQVQNINPSFTALHFVVWTSTIPVVPFMLLSYFFDEPAARTAWLETGWQSWTALIYLGLLATSFAFTQWTGLLKRHSANRVAPFSLGVPVVGLAGGIVILNEQISRWQWVGIAFVISALVVAMWPKKSAS